MATMDDSVPTNPQSTAIDVPIIFNTDLPPCGYFLQIAFTNVVGRLRRLWFQHATTPQATELILQICTLVKEELDLEAKAMPVGSQSLTLARQPWRREEVFRYELRWATYFLREAEDLTSTKVPNEMARQYQEFMDEHRPIPGSLQIFVRNRKVKRDVEKKWRKWNQCRRPAQALHVEQPLPSGDDPEEAIADDVASLI